MEIVDGRETNQANICIATAWFAEYYRRNEKLPQLNKELQKYDDRELVENIKSEREKALKFWETQDGGK